MSLASAMDDLIRKAQRSDQIPTEMVSIHLRRDGQIAKGLFSRTAATYHVRLDTKVEVGDIPVTVRDFRAQRSLPLTIRPRLWITKPGHLAASELEKHPYRAKETLANWIRDLVQEIVDSRETEDLAIWISLNTSGIEDKISQMLLERGFGAEIVINTEDLPESSILIETEQFSCRPRDIKVDVPMELSVRLDHVGAASEKPPANESEWRRNLKTIVRDYVERQESLDGVRQQDGFEARLREFIDAACKRMGWRVERFELKLDLSSFTRSFSGTFDVPWKSSEGREFRFTIKASMEIAAEGAAAYVRADSPDLEVWTRRNLEQCIADILFETDTDGLSPSNFNVVQSQLKESLEEKAVAVGLTVRLVVAEPSIEEWKFLKLREFEIQSLGYATTNPDITAVFSMVVTGQFKSVGPAFQASKLSGNISEQISDVAVDAAKLVIQRTEPAHYFAQFKEVDEAAALNERTVSVEQELKDDIRARLSKWLKFDVKDVQFTQIDPDFRAKQSELLKFDLGEVTVDILPAEISQNEMLPVGVRPKQQLIPFTFKGELQPADRKYAYNLAMRDLNLSFLRSLISGWAKECLNGKSYIDLATDHEAAALGLRRELSDKISGLLASYGVGIRVTEVSRGVSEVEGDAIDELVQMKLDRAKNQRQVEREKMRARLEYEKDNSKGDQDYLRALQERRTALVETDLSSHDDTNKSIEAFKKKRTNTNENNSLESEDIEDSTSKYE